MIVEFSCPVRIQSVNRTRNRHWSVRHKERNAQHEAIYTSWLAYVRQGQRKAIKRVLADAKPNDVVVRFTRVGPRKLDTDNLVAAAKAARDCIANILGVDDADPRVCWNYESALGKTGEYSLIVRIETREAATADAPPMIKDDDSIPF